MFIFLQNKYDQNKKIEPGTSGWVDMEWPYSNEVTWILYWSTAKTCTFYIYKVMQDSMSFQKLLLYEKL